MEYDLTLLTRFCIECHNPECLLLGLLPVLHLSPRRKRPEGEAS
jgi:hypothetical protein